MTKLERRQLLRHRRFQFSRGGFARFRQQFARFEVGRARRAHRRLGFLQFSAAEIERFQTRLEIGQHKGQTVWLGGIFARRGADGEQPLLLALEFRRIGFQAREQRIEFAAPLFGQRVGLLERCFGGGGRLARFLVHARQPLEGQSQRGFGAAFARQEFRRRRHVFDDARSVHQEGALGGERGLLALLGVERGEFVHRLSHVIGIGCGAGLRQAQAFELGAGRIEGGKAHRDLFRLCLVPAKGVEQSAMRGRVEQPAIVGLAVHFQ